MRGCKAHQHVFQLCTIHWYICIYIYLIPTVYSGSWRRKKQASTSSQWKVPLCVPIFLSVMFLLQSLFGSLDMCRRTERITSTESKHRRGVLTGELVEDGKVSLGNFSETTRARHIHEFTPKGTLQRRADLAVGPDVVRLLSHMGSCECCLVCYACFT